MKPTTLIVTLVAIVVAFLAGYGTGFIHGFRNAFWFDSPGKGTIDVIELKQLRRGDITKVIESKEDDLDWQIFLHSEYLSKGNPLKIHFYFNYFSDPQWKTADKDYRSFMNIIVKYRTEYPIQSAPPEFTKDADEKLKKEMTYNFNSRIETIKKTLNQYGWKEKPLTTGSTTKRD